MNRVLFILSLLSLTGCLTPVTQRGDGLQVVGQLSPRSSREIQASPFGIQFNAMPFHENAQYEPLNVPALMKDVPVLVRRASELGVKWARVSVDWGTVEDQRGVRHWEVVDAVVTGLVGARIEVYLCFHGGHATHTERRPPIQPAEIERWKDWVTETVQRYRDQIRYWEVWNEANSAWFWNRKPDAGQYMRLLRETAGVVRAHDKDAFIIPTGTARFDLPWFEQLFQLGVAEHADVLAFHPYSAFPEAIVREIPAQVRTPGWYDKLDHPVQGLKDLIAKSGKKIELWQGECGYPSAMNSSGWNGTGPWNDSAQCKWILRRALTDLSYDADVSCYFTLAEYRSGKKVNYKGLLAHETLVPKPAYHVYRNVCSLFTGDLAAVDQAINVETVAEGSFPGFQAKDIIQTTLRNDKGRVFHAYWLVARMQEKVRPARVNVTMHRDNLKRPVLVDLMTGQILRPQIAAKERTLVLKGLPLLDSPMVIMEEPE